MITSIESIIREIMGTHTITCQKWDTKTLMYKYYYLARF